MAKLPPIPVGVAPGHSFWNDWYEKLRNLINNNLLNHNDLQNIQGGSTTERYHLTSAQHTDLTDSGDSTLHYHASDRSRANHTGTQSVTTLDSYATNTWTPTIVGTTTPGAGTYTVNTGRYTKLGNVMFIYGALTWTAHTGAGDMRIAGLPEAALHSAPLASRFSNITYAQTVPYVSTIASSTELQCADFTSGAAAANIALDTAGSITFQGVCFI